MKIGKKYTACLNHLSFGGKFYTFHVAPEPRKSTIIVPGSNPAWRKHGKTTAEIQCSSSESDTLNCKFRSITVRTKIYVY